MRRRWSVIFETPNASVREQQKFGYSFVRNAQVYPEFEFTIRFRIALRLRWFSPPTGTVLPTFSPPSVWRTSSTVFTFSLDHVRTLQVSHNTQPTKGSSAFTYILEPESTIIVYVHSWIVREY